MIVDLVLICILHRIYIDMNRNYWCISHVGIHLYPYIHYYPNRMSRQLIRWTQDDSGIYRNPQCWYMSPVNRYGSSPYTRLYLKQSEIRKRDATRDASWSEMMLCEAISCFISTSKQHHITQVIVRPHKCQIMGLFSFFFFMNKYIISHVTNMYWNQSFLKKI